MQSFLTAASKPNTSEGGTREAEAFLNDKFVSCIDVVNKIKALSSLKNKMGKVPHSYTVSANNKWSKFERMKKRNSADKNMTIKPELSSNTLKSELLPSKDEPSPIIGINKKKIETEVGKEKSFRVRQRSQAMSSSRVKVISQQMERSSMINVRDPTTCTSEKTMMNLRKPNVQYSFNNQLMPDASLKDTIQKLKLNLDPFPNHISSDRLNPAGSLTERSPLNQVFSNHNILDSNQIDENQQSVTFRKKRINLAPEQSLKRDFVTRRSFLMKVDEANQIDKSALVALSQGQLKDRTYLKMGNLINEENQTLFDAFLQNFDRYSTMFDGFRVKGLQDYTAHPLEHFDTDSDPTLDIEYMLKQNNKAKSRWAKRDGTVSWRDCTIVSYNKATDQFEIVWEGANNETKKTVTRMNLLFPGEDPINLEARRVKANVVRCMYLLEDSLRKQLLTKEMLEKCRLYFSYKNFKQIMENSKIDNQTFNQSDFLCMFLLEVFDEYAIEILRFFVDYKTSTEYDAFIHRCE
jgi:hypothetical protein